MADIAPQTEPGRAGLRALVDDPFTALVAVDFDGTLAPIVSDPAQARAHPEAVDALGALARHVGHLAIVTGRPATTAVEYAGLSDTGPGRGLDSLVVLGHYGLERWDGATGEVTRPDPHPGVQAARDRLPELLAAHDAEQAYVEDKGAALGVHTRRLPQPQEALDRLREPMQALADDLGLALEPGRFVLELRPPGMDKGAALRALVDELGAQAVLFAGDDLGDLAAFDAVDELRAAGTPGLLVCSGSDEVTALAARADVVVDGPDGVVALLRALAALLHRA